MISLQWWMRVVGVFYVLLFVGVLAKAPIKAEGPPGVIERAAAGDATARFVIDVWTTLGLALFVLGASLLYFSWIVVDVRPLVCTIVALELFWGIPIDIYKIARGYPKRMLFVWIAIHVAIVSTGLAAVHLAA
jgi:hypothetical protein